MSTLWDGLTEASRDTLVANAGHTLVSTSSGFVPGDNAGRYRILETIGAGGMGVVYAAYDPKLDRRIALKLLRPRADGSRVERAHRTLLQEAQAMARLAHPNVVAVHDVGTLDEAVFVAMEYVEGQTLRERIDTARTAEEIDALLELFRQAGRGLAAAHAAGIVHRDFKPDNVLVGVDGRVRVLDFGLAHELGTSLAGTPSESEQTEPNPGARPPEGLPAFDANGQTQHSYARGGTPAYMSPEQFDNAHPDPRSDQYSFCVALYEALYDRHPYEAETFVELYVAVTEGNIVQPPSTGPERPELRAAMLRGLSLDPNARWPSMHALLAELEPPLPSAAVPTRWLVLGFGLLAGLTALAAVLWPRPEPEPLCLAAASKLAQVWSADSRARVEAGLLAASPSYGAQTWDRVATQIDTYGAAWAAMHTQTCEATELHHTQSEQLLDLRMACLERRRGELGGLVELFAGADTTVVENAVSALRSLPPLSRCADVDALLSAIPPPADAETKRAVEGLRERLRQLDALRWAGRDSDAAPIAQTLLEQAEATAYLPLAAQVRLSGAIIDEQLGDYARARERLEATYADALSVGDEGLATLAAQRLILIVGYRLQQAEGGRVWAAVAQARNAAQDPEGPGMAISLSYEGLVLHAHGDHTEALVQHQRAVALFRALPEQRAELAATLNNLAMTTRVLGDGEAAELIYNEVLAIRREVFGASHPIVGSTLHNYALLHVRRGEYEQALALELEGCELLRASLGEDTPRISTCDETLAVIYDSMGDWAKAEPLYERALAGLRRQLGETHPDVATAEMNLGGGLFAAGDLDRAKQLYERALAAFRSELGEDHPDVAMALSNLAVLEEVRERYPEAVGFYSEAIAVLEASHGLRHPSLGFPLLGLGRTTFYQHDFAASIAVLERALSISSELLDDPNFHADIQFALAQSLRSAAREGARSEALAREALTTYGADSDSGEIVEAWLEDG